MFGQKNIRLECGFYPKKLFTGSQKTTRNYIFPHLIDSSFLPGYGHIAPKTNLGRAVTIIYAIIGIPMFLILLADFGKTFTRGLKFLWAYVRRLYYHGTCRKVRKNHHYLDVMNGINTVYDAAIRRPSTYFFDTENYDVENANKQPTTPMSVNSHGSNNAIFRYTYYLS